MKSNSKPLAAGLTAHFTQIEEAMRSVGAVVLPVPSQEVVFQRYVLFIEVLNDWKIVCERYDSALNGMLLAQAQIRNTFRPGFNRPNEEERALLERLGSFVNALKLDIRSFYIFAKIPLIAYASLLFAMARRSGGWKSLTKFMKALEKPTAPTLFKAFHRRFAHDLEWFDAHVNLYRNDFIEHPLAGGLKGVIFSESGAKIAGLMGAGIGDEELALLVELQATVGDTPSPSATPLDRYLWLCTNLDKIPPKYNEEVKRLVRRVGLESGDLDELASRISNIFAGFLLFFAEWKNRREHSGIQPTL